MTELETLKDCISKKEKINLLPLQVQEKIIKTLEMLDEAYGTGNSNRTLHESSVRNHTK